MTLPPVRELVPHGAAMVLIDRVLSASADCACVEVRIHPGALFFDDGAIGSWVGIEYMAQAIAAHAGNLARLRGEPPKAGFLLGARRYQANVPAFADGAVLHVHAQHAMQGENGLAAFECRIVDVVDGAVLALATITVFEPNNVDEFLQRSQT